jgi:1-acyl-sn-glycerol-3-phosphate acyltransferase
MRRLTLIVITFTYYLSWIWFGLGGLLLNFGCVLVLPFARSRRVNAAVRVVIRSLLRLWLWWCHSTWALRVHWRGFDGAHLKAGTVYIANHPSLIDAPVLLARLPDTLCVFKPELLRNPFIGPAAIAAGFASGGDGIDAIRHAAAGVLTGAALLIFPEGTRTSPGARLNPLKPGFAVIAKRGAAPIRLIHIRTSPRLTPRGRAWWKLPALPASIELTLGEEIAATSVLTPAEIAAQVAQQLAPAEPLPG